MSTTFESVETKLAAVPLRASDLISIRDLSSVEIEGLLALAAAMKASPRQYADVLAGKQLVMFFEKPSLRTRLTFEAGMASMGGTAFFVDQTRSRLDARESLSDIAQNLERWIDGIVLRVFAHATVTGMAEHAGIPVINALSDLEHPCQALADYLTLREKFGDLSKVKLAFVGDGNNVAHSLMLAAALTGRPVRDRHAGGLRAERGGGRAGEGNGRANRRSYRVDERSGGGGQRCSRRVHRRVGQHGAGAGSG